MIGLVGRAVRAPGEKSPGGLWAVLVALLLGGAVSLSVPPPLPIDGRPIVIAAGTPWGGATVPEPQAEVQRSLAAAILPSLRGKSSSSPWPTPESPRLAGDSSRRPDARRTLTRRPAPATAPAAKPPILAYDPHGPPFAAL